jgi:hypothetical protein
MYLVGTTGGAGFTGSAVPDGTPCQDTLPLSELKQAHDTVGGMFHEGGHGTTGRTFAALETAPHRCAGQRLDFAHKVHVHRFLRDDHFFLFHNGFPVRFLHSEYSTKEQKSRHDWQVSVFRHFEASWTTNTITPEGEGWANNPHVMDQ